MRSIWHHSWYTIPLLIFFVVGLSITLTVPYSDESIALNAWRVEPLNTFFRYVTRLGEINAWVMVVPLVFAWRWRYGLLLLATGVCTLPLVYALKDLYEVDRPSTFFRVMGAEHLLVTIPDFTLNSGYHSFPSGHTISAFALTSLLALMLGRRLPMLGLALVWTAILVAISRVFLLQHFVVDVVAGAAFGVLLADLAWQLDRRFLARFRWLDRGFF
jgi:membrane-associated phospholipid phosphatase